MAKLVTKAKMFLQDEWRRAGHIFDGDKDDEATAQMLEQGTVEEYDPEKHGDLPEAPDADAEKVEADKKTATPTQAGQSVKDTATPVDPNRQSDSQKDQK